MNRVIQSSFCLAAVLLAFSIAKPAGKSVEQTAASNDVKTQGNPIFGFRDSTAELKWEKIFLAAPDPKRAEGHLRVLTTAPHMAATPEDRQTAEYVAQKFRETGLETQVVAYKVW